MNYPLENLLEVIESRLHAGLASLKDSKHAYKELNSIKEYGSVEEKIRHMMDKAPDLDFSVLK